MHADFVYSKKAYIMFLKKNSSFIQFEYIIQIGSVWGLT